MRVPPPARRTARRLLRLCVADDEVVPARVEVVVRRVAASGGRRTLPILTHFHRLLILERGRRTAVVESARPLPGDVRAAITASLERRYGGHLVTLFRHDPALIGGVRVSVGSTVYDGTIRARLAALGARL